MVDYWLDTDSLIEPAKNPYAFDIVPGYWDVLVQQAMKDKIASPMRVYHEVKQGYATDPLVAWVEEFKDTVFVEPDEDVQDAFRKVLAHVMGAYPGPHGDRFIDAADPWLIAHAAAKGGTIVTLEKPSPPGSKSPKIPDVCKHFGMSPITPYDMLRKLGVKFGVQVSGQKGGSGSG